MPKTQKRHQPPPDIATAGKTQWVNLQTPANRAKHPCCEWGSPESRLWQRECAGNFLRSSLRMATCGRRKKWNWTEGEGGMHCNPEGAGDPTGYCELGWPFRVVPSWGQSQAFTPSSVTSPLMQAAPWQGHYPLFSWGQFPEKSSASSCFSNWGKSSVPSGSLSGGQHSQQF